MPLTSLMIIVKMNHWREELGSMGLHIVNSNEFFPPGGKPRVLDRPDITSRVYNQFAKDIMKDLAPFLESHSEIIASKWLQNWSSTLGIHQIITYCCY